MTQVTALVSCSPLAQRRKARALVFCIPLTQQHKSEPSVAVEPLPLGSPDQSRQPADPDAQPYCSAAGPAA